MSKPSPEAVIVRGDHWDLWPALRRLPACYFFGRAAAAEMDRAREAGDEVAAKAAMASFNEAIEGAEDVWRVLGPQLPEQLVEARRVRQIVELCALAGRPEAVPEMLRSGRPPEHVLQHLLRERRAAVTIGDLLCKGAKQ